VREYIVRSALKVLKKANNPSPEEQIEIATREPVGALSDEHENLSGDDFSGF